MSRNAAEVDQTRKKNRWQKSEHASLVILLVSFLLIAPFMYESLLLNHWVVQNKNDSADNDDDDDQEYISYSHVLIMLCSVVVTQALERILTKLFQPVFQNVAKHPVDYHSEKSARYTYGLLYHLTITLYGYQVLRNSLPWQLLGTMSMDDAFEMSISGRPYLKADPSIVVYAFVCLGYQFGDLFAHAFFQERKSDYYEMLLHHFVTVVLFFGMILGNHIVLGCMIAYLHNLADILGSAIKCCASTRFNKLSVVIFLTMMMVWFWTRLCVFPQIVYRLIFLDPIGMPIFYRISTLFLSLLQMMHFYWFYLFILMLIRFSKDGSTDDIQSQKAQKEKQ